MKIVKVPVLDTGLGREAGYDSDADLIKAWEAQRAAPSSEQRALEDEHTRRITEQFVLGAETCPFCGSTVVMVVVHGHAQCPACRTVVHPCCEGASTPSGAAVSRG